jgi:hypothetical protein
MNRRELLGGTAAWLAILSGWQAQAAAPLPEVHVFKSPTCGCCGAWIDHMKAAGFPVRVTEVNDTTAARSQLGMPERYGSCHSASVAGYVLEGHVPAAEVKRLLKARPTAIGLAVPGMPPSAPGMDVPGRKDPYQVMLIDGAGQSSVYANYPK